MSGKPKYEWGGARPGAGRKTKPVSVRQLNAMLRKGRKWAKKTGYDVDEFLLAVVGGNKEKIGATEIHLRDRITCAKIWKEYTMTKVSDQNINVTKQSGPVIGLPPIREDPALKIMAGGKDQTEKKEVQ
jgi:hypothetical protein